MTLSFKKWLNENGTSSASIATVPNRLFGSNLIPYYAQPIGNYVKFGLGGKVVKACSKKKKNKFFDN